MKGTVTKQRPEIKTSATLMFKQLSPNFARARGVKN